MLRLIAWISSLIFIGAPITAIVLFTLAVAGSPGSCENEARPIAIGLEHAAAFDVKWNQLNDSLASGQPASTTFTESEATSRARVFVEQNNVDVKDLFVCFSTDGGGASGKVDVPFLPGDVDVLARGTLDLTGEHPVAEIEDVEIGGLPGPLTDFAKSFVNDLIEEQTEKVMLRHNYGLAFEDGEATASGQP